MIEPSITTRGRTTLPRPVRNALGVQPGDRVRHLIHDGGVRIVPARPLDRLFGVLRSKGPPATLDDMESGAIEGATEP